MAMNGKKGRLSGLKLSPYKTELFDSLLERDYMLELENTSGVKEWTKNHNIKIPLLSIDILINLISNSIILS